MPICPGCGKENHMCDGFTEQPGSLRVWWVRNPPSPAKMYMVPDIESAIRLLKQLGATDANDPNISSNAGGLEEFDGRQWSEWYNQDGEDIDDVMNPETDEEE